MRKESSVANPPRTREIGVVTIPEDLTRRRFLNGGKDPTIVLTGETLERFEAQERALDQQIKETFLNEFEWTEERLRAEFPSLFPD